MLPVLAGIIATTVAAAVAAAAVVVVGRCRSDGLSGPFSFARVWIHLTWLLFPFLSFL